jgi:hypothetical protein
MSTNTDTVFYNGSGFTSVAISGPLTSTKFPSGYTVSNITRVDIGTTVTSIGNAAFMDASSLSIVTFKEDSSVTSIGNNAFYQTSLTSINIPKSVLTIGDNAFFNSGLTTATVNYARLGEINFPTNIGAEQSIGGCDQPKGYNPVLIIGYNIPSNLTVFYTDDDNTSVDISGPLSSPLSGSTQFPSGYTVSNITQVAIGNTVTSIAEAAFLSNPESPSPLRTVTFEVDSSVTSIGDAAFKNATSLTSIVIPESVTTIEDQAFQNTSSLTSIVIPSSVTDISSNSFTSSGISGKTIGIEQPSSLAVIYNTPTTFFGATNVTIVRALSPPSGNGWYLFGIGSSGLPWSSAKIAWGLNGYNIYQYIYDLSGSPIPGGTPLTSDNWTAIDIIGNDPVLPEYSAYWVQVIPYPEPDPDPITTNTTQTIKQQPGYYMNIEAVASGGNSGSGGDNGFNSAPGGGGSYYYYYPGSGGGGAGATLKYSGNTLTVDILNGNVTLTSLESDIIVLNKGGTGDDFTSGSTGNGGTGGTKSSTNTNNSFTNITMSNGFNGKSPTALFAAQNRPGGNAGITYSNYGIGASAETDEAAQTVSNQSVKVTFVRA